jgi:hypothetical protein
MTTTEHNAKLEAQIIARLAGLDIGQLKQAAHACFADDDKAADVVLHHALGELERRIPEAEFVAFCKTIA